jgi:predicted RNA-binding Zn ribbon-like protein
MATARPAPPVPLPVFEFSGGNLALDFVNTWPDRSRQETDRLGTFPDLQAFVRQGGQAAGGRAGRSARAPEAARVLRAARRLREALFRLFTAGLRGRPAEARDLTEVNARLREALQHLELRALGEELGWREAEATARPGALLWPVVRAAAALLTSPDLARVRECEAPDCTWLFLDRSRAGKRRWCSMTSCGNRAKARRHYHRQRKG